MPPLKSSVGIQRKSGSGFQPLRRGKMPRPLFEAEPRNLADIVSVLCSLFLEGNYDVIDFSTILSSVVFFKSLLAHSQKEVAGRKNSSGRASTKKVCHCEERKRRSNLDRKDCFASLAMTRSHLWGVATILAYTFFRECALSMSPKT